jgi:hypothetical protein
MKRRVLGLGGLIAAVLVVGAWQMLHATGTTGPVTEAEARAFLNRIVAAARAGDLDKVCHLNGSVHNCQRTLEIVGSTVPPDPPKVVAARYFEKRSAEDTPGMLLVVEGVNWDHKPYSTDVYIFREDAHTLKATNAVYWSGFKVPADDITTPYPTSGATALPG